ncbi:unnamed protein product [Oreochromis niloticus]|nr:unnamed protein product [Mustela putorius furo]
MVIAIEICDNIKAYGMVLPNHCGTPGIKKVRYHYYDRWWVNECATYFQHENRRSQGQHRFITEKRVFARWAKQYNITFTHPRW